MAVLVSGGGGNIGSHIVKRLVEHGEDVVVVDNFCTGFRDAIVGGKIIQGNFGDQYLIKEILRYSHFDVVIITSSSIEVAESAVNPIKYYMNNVNNFINLLAAIGECGVSNIIFFELCCCLRGLR
jgi:UDP-glucose 4-epimerase